MIEGSREYNEGLVRRLHKVTISIFRIPFFGVTISNPACVGCGLNSGVAGNVFQRNILCNYKCKQYCVWPSLVSSSSCGTYEWESD